MACLQHLQMTPLGLCWLPQVLAACWLRRPQLLLPWPQQQACWERSYGLSKCVLQRLQARCPACLLSWARCPGPIAAAQPGSALFSTPERERETRVSKSGACTARETSRARPHAPAALARGLQAAVAATASVCRLHEGRHLLLGCLHASSGEQAPGQCSRHSQVIRLRT